MTNNINLYLEWTKWLEYEPVFEKERITFLSLLNKPSYNEISELREYQYYQYMLKLFKLYDKMKCTPAEILKINDFLINEPLEKFMLRKLTKDELIKAKISIAKNTLKSTKELEVIINEMQNKYSNLSMLDSYIYHLTNNLYQKRLTSNQKINYKDVIKIE